MRTGVAVSVIGHVGAVMITLLAFPATQEIVSSGGSVVPVEIVDVALESNVRALAIEVPEEAEAPEIAEEQEASVSPSPRAPQQQPRTPQQEQDDFLRRTQDILNDTQKTRGQIQEEGAPAETNQSGAGLGTAQQVALEDRARALVDSRLRRCWRVPDDLPDPERLVVVLSIQVNRNGTLSGQPRLVRPSQGSLTFDAPMREAVNRAMRAVRECDPYTLLPEDPVVGEHFQVWREMEIRFGRRP